MQRAFTLIELLVVITIIAVLLALLTPALDKAIYQAELAVCAAQLKGIAVGATTYALDHKRSYPYRNAVGRGWFPQELTNWQNEAEGLDDRPTIKGYININGYLNCPLSKKVDLEGSASGPTGSWILTSYCLWYGWQYQSAKGMIRMGDRFEWNNHSFSLLASDHDLISQANSIGEGSHPDKAEKWVNVVYQDQYTAGVTVGAVGAGALKLTLSRWQSSDLQRGPIDMNFALADGSVVRLNDVLWDEGHGDDRLTAVPVSANAPSPTATDWINVPLR